MYIGVVEGISSPIIDHTTPNAHTNNNLHEGIYLHVSCAAHIEYNITSANITVNVSAA
jgi:hypothetical protein